MTQPHYINGKKIDCKIAIPKELLNSATNSTNSNSKSSKGTDKKKKKKRKNEKKLNSSKIYNLFQNLGVNNLTPQTSPSITTSSKSVPLYLRKMFVGGLHPYLTKEELINYFNQFGQVEKGIIMTDKVTGRSRGFGFIIFSNKETIDKIMSISNCHFLYGKWIECKRAQPKEQSIKMLSDNNTYPSLNSYNNDNLVLNDIISDHSKSLLGDKYKSDMNLFTYQNYVPKEQIKHFLQNNMSSFNHQNSLSSQNQNLNDLPSSSSSTNGTATTTSNSISNSHLPRHTFQNYYYNCITNVQTYNYFHYKLFDSTGEELIKSKLYKNPNKIKVYPDENSQLVPKDKANTSSNNNNAMYANIFYPEDFSPKENLFGNSNNGGSNYNFENDIDVSSDFVEESEKEYSENIENNSDDCLGPNKQRGKNILEGNSNDSFRPY